jgi:D-glycero-D-manno-heptose 1,7-bisphosphate phosphatase
MSPRAAVFLDRDGTLTLPRHYPSRPEHLVLRPDVVPVLRALRSKGWLLVVVTNQSGVARGYFTAAELDLMHADLRARLAAAGAPLDGVYHCPHHPDGAVAELAIRCPCRKPEPGLLARAATDLGIDLGASWMVGDAASDVEAGRRAGCRTVLVGHRPDGTGGPDFVAPSTAQALRQILAGGP